MKVGMFLCPLTAFSILELRRAWYLARCLATLDVCGRELAFEKEKEITSLVVVQDIRRDDEQQ